jgi:predicted DNA-binding ribbon-helix-helix protein
MKCLLVIVLAPALASSQTVSAISPISVSVNGTGSIGAVSITAPPDTAWIAVSEAAWIRIYAGIKIAVLERCSINDLCSAVDRKKPAGASFSSALRVYLMQYYRAAYKTRLPLDLDAGLHTVVVQALKSKKYRLAKAPARRTGTPEDAA